MHWSEELGYRRTVRDKAGDLRFYQEAARLPNAERIHWLRQERWIQYPRAERILERLIDLVDYPPHHLAVSTREPLAL